MRVIYRLETLTAAAAINAHRAGRLIWELLVGLAYLLFGVYLILHPVLGAASLTLVLASVFRYGASGFTGSKCQLSDTPLIGRLHPN